VLENLNFESVEGSAKSIVESYVRARALKEMLKDNPKSYADLTVIEFCLETLVNALLKQADDVKERASVFKESILSNLGLMG